MKFTKVIYIALVAFLLTNCSTKEKFSVYAPSGTKIYTPDNINTSAVITSADKVKVIVPSDMYCGYILAQTPGLNLKVPIGLDYRHNRHNGTRVGIYTGAVLGCVGLGATLICGGAAVAAASQDDSDSSSDFALVVAAGAGVAAIGSALGAPSQARMRQTAYDYNFSYEKNQRLKMPVLSSSLLNPNPPKIFENEVKGSSNSRRKASSGNYTQNKTEIAHSSKVNRSRSDNARKIEGKYTGKGKLLRNKVVDEIYSKISVILERMDKNHVSVRIIESEEDYFDAPLVYEIQKSKDGGYDLHIDKLPEAVIKITKDGRMIFNHGKVNIENILYKLEITADKTE